MRVSLHAETTAFAFADFVDEIQQSLANNPLPNGIGNPPRFFLWDNLRSHLAPIVFQTVADSGLHEIIPRPPYCPKDGPIEYFFCQVVCELRNRLHAIHTLQDLIQQIHSVVGQIGGVDATFAKIGYAP